MKQVLANVKAKMLPILVISYLLGFSVARMSSRIVGGQFAAINEFPYAAFLSIQCKSYVGKASVSWRCGSSIVNQYILMTAAHCVDPQACGNVDIMASVGDPDRRKGLVSTAYSYIIHENFTTDFASDLALIRLKSPLEFNARVSRVALMKDPPLEEKAIIAGWGRVHPTLNVLTNDLKYTKLIVWKKETCEDLLNELKPGTFCASGNFTGNVLNGDSGGALVVRDYIQIGICSYFKPKTSKTVSVFTDVAYHYDWIKENINSIMCETK